LEDNLNRIQYVILNIMKKRKAVDHMHSMSCNEISAIENRCKVTTIYKHICILEEKGYVEKGAKIERAFGYILTEKALDMLPKEEMEGNKDE
jgi:repressor of nif and glnA expression